MTDLRRLQAVIDRWQKTPLAWDRNCAMFISDCVEAMTGVDPIADIRAKITSARGFAEVLRSEGGMVAAVTKRLGNPIAPRRAHRGDVVGVDRRGIALGVCMGSVALFVDDNGLTAHPMRSVTHAWGLAHG